MSFGQRPNLEPWCSSTNEPRNALKSGRHACIPLSTDPFLWSLYPIFWAKTAENRKTEIQSFDWTRHPVCRYTGSHLPYDAPAVGVAEYGVIPALVSSPRWGQRQRSRYEHNQFAEGDVFLCRGLCLVHSKSLSSELEESPGV